MRRRCRSLNASGANFGAAPGGTSIGVLIADDHAMFRQGLKEMLQTNEKIEVVGEAENGVEAVALAKRLAPDVVLLDVQMPLLDAEEVIRRMVGNPPEDSPPPKVIVVSMYDDPRLVRKLIGLGVVGYLVKSASMEELLSAIHAAADGSEGPEDAVMVAPPEARRDPEPSGELTERELELLRMAAGGMSNQEIATSLRISDKTVKRHLANVYPKMGVYSRGEAARMALSEGWISPRDMTNGGTEVAP